MSNQLLIDKAERFIISAKLLNEAGDYDSAASRLYYAMFYMAEAMLNVLGLSFSSHKAVISMFGQHFAKTNLLDPRFHQSLIAAYSQRQLGDYAIVSQLNQADIEHLIKEADDFVTAGKKWLADNPCTP